MQFSSAQWHLLFNHFPIILSITAAGLMVLAFFIRNKGFVQTAMFVLVLAGISAIPAFQTGEGAEETVEELAGVDHQQIHVHEHQAQTGMRVTVGAGIIALIGMLWMRSKKVQPMLPVVLVAIAAFTSSYFMTMVGHSGGLIRPPEISADGGGSTPVMQNDHRDDDDD